MDHATNVGEKVSDLLAAVAEARMAGCYVNLPSHLEAALRAISVSDTARNTPPLEPFAPVQPRPEEVAPDSPVEEFGSLSLRLSNSGESEGSP